MIYLEFRQETEDIDYTARLEGDMGDFVSAVRGIIRDLDLSVEPAGPGDFIPLPRGWEDRSQFVGRFGSLDVFTFDPLSTALAKIERGSDRDIRDALALIRTRRVSVSQLKAGFEEILPRLERESVRVDDEDFRRKVEAFIRLVSD